MGEAPASPFSVFIEISTQTRSLVCVCFRFSCSLFVLSLIGSQPKTRSFGACFADWPCSLIKCFRTRNRQATHTEVPLTLLRFGMRPWLMLGVHIRNEDVPKF